MASKKFEINLTPQNEEWIKLIPNQTQNNDIVFNKLIEMAINEGLLLEVISQSLTMGDLSKFKTAYGKMQTKRAGFLDELDVTPSHVERKRVVQTMSVEVDEEEILPTVEIKEPPKQKKKVAEKKVGWDEDTF